MSSLLKSNTETASDDLIERGQSTYRQRLASVLEPSHDGEFVAVEPDSGRYFLENTASEALIDAHAARPNNLFYIARIGRETAHVGGGRHKNPVARCVQNSVQKSKNLNKKAWVRNGSKVQMLRELNFSNRRSNGMTIAVGEIAFHDLCTSPKDRP